MRTRSSLFTPSHLRSLLLPSLLLGALFLAPPCQAQNAQPADAPEAKPLSDEGAFAATQREANALAATSPEAAAALYTQLLRERPRLSPYLNERSTSAAARLARSNNLTAALSLLDEGAKRVSNAAGVTLRLLGTRADILIGANRAGEAEAALEPQRQRLLAAYPQGPSIPQSSPYPAEVAELLLAHLESLEAQEKWSEMAQAAREALWRVPGLLEDRSVPTPAAAGGGNARNNNARNGNARNGNARNNNGKNNNGKGKAQQQQRAGLGDAFYDRLVSGLQKANRPEEALGWARLRFEVCAFEKGAIDRAVGSLRAVWIGNGQLNKPGQFNTFLRDASKENPLRAIALPTVETAEVEAYLSALVPPSASAEVRAGGPESKNSPMVRVLGGEWGRQSQRVSLLLLLRRYPEAAQVAQGMLQANPGGRMGQDQIARVLKAREGSLESGNRFYEFLKTGEGDNPLQTLLAK